MFIIFMFIIFLFMIFLFIIFLIIYHILNHFISHFTYCVDRNMIIMLNFLNLINW